MNWAVVAVVGGTVGLDATSFPQVMISRPFVAATLTGWALGDPASGAMLGALHEVFNLAVLPVGASRYPEAGTAAVAATAGLLAAPVSWATVLVTLAFALGWERIAGATVVGFRRGIEPLLATAAGEPLPTPRLERRHGLAILLDFLRAAAVSTAGAGLATVLVTALASRVALTPTVIGTAIAVAAAAALGGTMRVFGGWTDQRRAFLIGAALACLFLVLR